MSNLEGLSLSRRFRLGLAMSLLAALIVFFIGEIAIRLLVKPSLQGPALGKRELAPREWQPLRARMREIWKKASGHLSYLVYDPKLGWDLGPNRRSVNGLYFSGTEGIRTSRVGETFAKLPPKRLIAVLGDSFAFGEEVAHQATFPYRLEQTLGSGYRVLNFAVPGYGLNQMYLKYLDDVQSWHPDIVILAFISHDLLRTMSVYTFLAFPHWEMPFMAPRMRATPDGLRPVHEPTLSPDQMLAYARVQDLPFLEYDFGYNPLYWEPAFSHFPYLVRLAAPRLLRRLSPNPNETDQATFSLNEAILAEFMGKAKQNESLPVVVYMPSREDFDMRDPSVTLGRRFLRAAGASYIDPMPCLSAVDPLDRFTSENPHYAPRANAAVAECVAGPIRGLVEPSVASPAP